MRVLHISARSDTGGGPEMIRNLIEGSASEAEHWVACPENGQYFEKFQRMLGESRVCGFPVNIRRVKPDIVHTHGFGAGLVGRLSGLGSGIPLVHTFHGFFPMGAGAGGGAVRLLAEAILGPLARAAVAVSESERRLVERWCPGAAGRTVVIPNGVRRRNDSATPQIASAKIRVVAVGRLVHQKNPELVPRIAAECKSLDPKIEFEFRIAGAGPLEWAILEQARALGVAGQVRLLGDTPYVAAELAGSHIYLSTARWEGLSLALLEAMHAGLPCVVSRVQGNVDAVEAGVSGFLYDVDRPEEAARHLIALARDPAARRRVGLEAQERARARFSVEAMCRQYVELYRRVA